MASRGNIRSCFREELETGERCLEYTCHNPGHLPWEEGMEQAWNIAPP